MIIMIQITYLVVLDLLKRLIRIFDINSVICHPNVLGAKSVFKCITHFPSINL